MPSECAKSCGPDRKPSMMEAQPIVFIIDDDKSVREGLSDLLRSVGLGAQTFESTQAFAQAKRPDVAGCIVLDVRLPGRSGLEFQQSLSALDIRMPVIFISGHGNIPISVRAMKSGAMEFLTKPLREQELLDSVQTAIERDRSRRREGVITIELRERFASLTAREQEIMSLVVAGQLNKQIGFLVGLSAMTVKVHRSHLMHKMQAKSLIDLVRIADK